MIKRIITEEGNYGQQDRQQTENTKKQRRSSIKRGERQRNIRDQRRSFLKVGEIPRNGEESPTFGEEPSLDLDVRFTDYLSCTGEEDKYVNVSRVENLSDFTWDFDKIEERISAFRANSEEYLRNVINR